MCKCMAKNVNNKKSNFLSLVPAYFKIACNNLLQLGSHLNDMCKTKELVKHHCCASEVKNHIKCATKLLLRHIGKANKVKESGRKKCPLNI